MLMSEIITVDFFKQWCFSAEAVCGLDLHETKRSYTSSNGLQKLNKYSCRDCVWIAHFSFFSASLLRIGHIASPVVMQFQSWKSIHFSYSMFPWVILLVSRNAIQACLNQLQDLKTYMKTPYLPIWRHIPKKYCIIKKPQPLLKKK